MLRVPRLARLESGMLGRSAKTHFIRSVLEVRAHALSVTHGSSLSDACCDASALTNRLYSYGSEGGGAILTADGWNIASNELKERAFLLGFSRFAKLSFLRTPESRPQESVVCPLPFPPTPNVVEVSSVGAGISSGPISRSTMPTIDLPKRADSKRPLDYDPRPHSKRNTFLSGTYCLSSIKVTWNPR